MIGYVDRVEEIRKELDLILDGCDFSELSSTAIVEMALRTEKLISQKN